MVAEKVEDNLVAGGAVRIRAVAARVGLGTATEEARVVEQEDRGNHFFWLVRNEAGEDLVVDDYLMMDDDSTLRCRTPVIGFHHAISKEGDIGVVVIVKERKKVTGFVEYPTILQERYGKNA